MHLHGETLERYVDSDLPDDQLAILDEHISNCFLCAAAFAHTGAVSDRWERCGWLGRLVRVDSKPSVADDLGERIHARAA